MTGRDLLRAAVPVVAALLGLVAWGLSSPPGSSPDEHYHLASIWCGQGVDAESCEEGSTDATRTIPRAVAEAQCFNMTPKSAGCRPPHLDRDLEPDFETGIGNWTGAYPPVYYAVMHTLVGDRYDQSVLLMRFANAVVAVGLVTCLALLLPRRLGRLPGLVFLVSSVPVLAYFLASVNPTGWTLLSAGTLWLALYAAFEVTGRRWGGLVAIAVVSTLLGAGSRADGSLFAIVGVCVALGLRLSLLRTQWRTALVGVLLAVLAAAIFLSTGQKSAAGEGFAGFEPVDLPGDQLFAGNALQVPFLWIGNFGLGPQAALGWFDTPLPGIVGIAAGFVVAAVTVQGWGSWWWQKGVALAAVAAGMVVYPIVMLQQTGVQVGIVYQPRYVFPLLLMFIGVSLLHRDNRPPAFSTLQAVALVILLSVANSAALWANMIRHTHGPFTGDPAWFSDPQWWWDAGWLAPGAVWATGSAAFLLLAWSVVAPLRHGRSVTPR